MISFAQTAPSAAFVQPLLGTARVHEVAGLTASRPSPAFSSQGTYVAGHGDWCMWRQRAVSEGQLSVGAFHSALIRRPGGGSSRSCLATYGSDHGLKRHRSRIRSPLRADDFSVICHRTSAHFLVEGKASARGGMVVLDWRHRRQRPPPSRRVHPASECLYPTHSLIQPSRSSRGTVLFVRRRALELESCSPGG